MLDHHWRGKIDGAGRPCPGGGRPAWKRTPYYSEKAAFRTSGGKAICPYCKKNIPIIPLVTVGARLKWHPTRDGLRDCPGSGQLAKNAERLPLSAVR